MLLRNPGDLWSFLWHVLLREISCSSLRTELTFSNHSNNKIQSCCDPEGE